jgi:two-component system, OmpR family, KDP operon response regulator KdpE
MCDRDRDSCFGGGRRAAHTPSTANLSDGWGFVVEEACTPSKLWKRSGSGHSIWFLLDVSMPGVQALELCAQLRALEPEIGILLPTVSTAEKDIVKVLEAGADDYITKPFREDQLLARCRVVLRRIRAANAKEEVPISAGDLELDLGRRRLRKAGEVVHLTPTEFNLLALLMKNQGMALTHAQLLRTVWGPEYGAELEYLRSYVRMLRKKIETDPTPPKYLVTEPCLGCRFCSSAN